MLSENSVMHPHFRSALSRCLSSASLSTARTKETLHPALTRCVASTNLSAVSAEETAPKEELDKLYRMLEIEVRGNDPAVLKSFSWFAATAAQHLEIKVGNWYVRLFAVYNN